MFGASTGTSVTAEAASPLVARLVFLLVVVGFPLQMLIAEREGEPYPGLFQPSFAGSPLKDGVLTGVQSVVTIMFEGGGGKVADIRDIMPSSRLNARTVFRSAFYDERLATDPETVDWLQRRIESAFPGRTATRMVVEWERTTRVEAESWRLTRSVDKTITVPLGVDE